MPGVVALAADDVNEETVARFLAVGLSSDTLVIPLKSESQGSL